MYSRKITGIIFIAALFILTSCGGGSGSTQETVTDNGETEVALGQDGEMVFAEGSMPKGASILVEEVQYPALISDLEPVGQAYKVTVDTQPSAPVQISLNIPAGETASELALIRAEENGTITLLQTDLENNKLVAYTPGFSTLVLARLKGLFNSLKPGISGPDALPVGVVGQYQDEGFDGVAGLDRVWNYSGINGELNYAVNPLGNSSALFKGLEVGTYLIRVTFKIPGTYIYASANKSITVVETLESFNGLKMTVYGPTMVVRDHPDDANDRPPTEIFDVTARVLSTDISQVTKWQCEIISSEITLDCGSCTEDCTSVFMLKDFSFIYPFYGEGFSSMELTAFASVTSNGGFDTFGKITLPIWIVHDKPLIKSISGNTTNRFWTSLLQKFDFDVTTTIEGGEAPYDYSWTLQPKDISEFHGGVNLLTDQFNFSVSDPGVYALNLKVTDANEEFAEGIYPVSIMPSDLFKPVKTRFIDNPENPVEVNTVVQFDMGVTGSYLVFDGRRVDYFYALDWGDETGLTTGYISAENVIDGGTETVSHRYTKKGDYQVRLVARPNWFNSVETIVPMFLADDTDKSLSKIEIIVEDSEIPEVGVEATDWNADEDGQDPAVFTFTRTGNFDESLTLFFELTGSAEHTVDYIASHSSRVTIPSGEVSAIIEITPYIDDVNEEGDEFVVMTLKPDDSYSIGDTGSAQITIADLAEEPVLVSIVATTSSAYEKGERTGLFTITRTGDLSNELNVQLTKEATATLYTDYRLSSRFITRYSSEYVVFASGENSIEIVVTPRDDTDVDEGEETIQISIDPPRSYDRFSIGDSAFATVFIVDRGPIVYILDTTELSKHIDENDLCGQDLSCKHTIYPPAMSRTTEYQWFLYENSAQHIFEEIYVPNGTVVSDYTVDFTYQTPPSTITAGTTVDLNITGSASGFTAGWFLDHSFTYWTNRSDEGVSISNRELPYDSENYIFTGTINKEATAHLEIPLILDPEMTISGVFGPIHKIWTYKLED